MQHSSKEELLETAIKARKRPLMVEVSPGQEETIHDGSLLMPERDCSWRKLVKARKRCS